MKTVLSSREYPVAKILRQVAQATFVVVGLGLAALSLVWATETKIQNHLLAGTPWKQNYTTPAERDRQLSCLALNVYKEAGYEPYLGKVAVAQVTMNRVASGQFPSDVCGVVYQKTVIESRTVCQFSWYCDPNHKNRPVNQDAYQESYDAARRVLFENYRLPALKNALYYHADYVRPGWEHTKQKLAKIGAHIFYSSKS